MVEIVCPTCGDDFASEGGMKVHHFHAHGESISGVLVECHHCGTSFRKPQEEVGEKNFCTRECYDNWRQETRGRFSCEECGEVFTRVPAKNAQNDGTYCSQDCYLASTGAKVEANCSNCGDTFERYPSQISTDTPCCSPECLGEFKQTRRPSFECAHCTEAFQRIPSRATGERLFCSRACQIAEQKDSATYEWHNSKNYGPTWRERRREARERDDYRCQACGDDQDDAEYTFHVHHIIPIERFETPAAANELENLVTLCAGCHLKWEGIPLRPQLG